MTDHTPSLYDAYAPPPVTAETPPSRNVVLGRLKTICIIALVLGSLGLLGSLRDLAGVVLSGRPQPKFQLPGRAKGGEEVQALSEEMQAEAQALDAKFRPVNALFVPLHVIVSGLLLAGGILGLRVMPAGRRLLSVGSGLAILFAVAVGVVQSILKIQAASLALDYMPQMMEAQGGVPGQAMEIGLAVGKGVMIAIVALSWVWVLAQVVFYAITIGYLRKPAVRELFESQS